MTKRKHLIIRVHGTGDKVAKRNLLQNMKQDRDCMTSLRFLINIHLIHDAAHIKFYVRKRGYVLVDVPHSIKNYSLSIN